MSTAGVAARAGLAGRRVVLGVTGGIAAVKSVPLARLLTQSGAQVETVLTRSARRFVRPLAFSALTGRGVHTSTWSPDAPLTHIQLARDADAVVVAPATADFLARAAAGMADDLLAATLLATRAPVVLCPAMNDRMYAHPGTGANLARLREWGYRQVGPAVGPLAWDEGEGPGRMSEPVEIVDHLCRVLAGDGPLRGRRVVVTAGGTREPLDPVRFLGNRSSGRMGFALARAAWSRGAEVTLISGPSELPTPTGVERQRVETAEQMRAAVAAAIRSAEVLIMAAAVADFRPVAPASGKIKRAGRSSLELQLEPTADVLASTMDLRPPRCIVVGFALETDDLLAHAWAKLEAKRLDLLVANSATEPGAGFEVETNRVTLLVRGAAPEALPLLGKVEVAERILDRIEALAATC